LIPSAFKAVPMFSEVRVFCTSIEAGSPMTTVNVWVRVREAVASDPDTVGPFKSASVQLGPNPPLSATTKFTW
jgi:hypothetical protein